MKHDSAWEEDVVKRLANGEAPYDIDPEHGCTNPLTGYFPSAEVEAEKRRRYGLPAAWKVVSVDRSEPGADWLLIGFSDDDTTRISMRVDARGDETEVLAAVVYPCATCGWGNRCEGECHS